jgi:hypothetical protein
MRPREKERSEERHAKVVRQLRPFVDSQVVAAQDGHEHVEW